MTPDVLLHTLLQFLLDGTYIPAAGLGVVAFTNAIKFILTKAGLTLPDIAQIGIALLVQFVVWVAWTLFTRLGVIDQFTPWYDAVVTIVMTLFPLLGGIGAAHIIYQKSKPASDVIALEGDQYSIQSVAVSSTAGSGGIPILGYTGKPKSKELPKYAGR